MIKTPKENQEFKRWVNPKPGDPAKPRQTRPKRLAPSGRAHTCQVSLTPAQADWLASRGCPASAVLRMLVDDAMRSDCPLDEWRAADAATVAEPVDIG